MRYVFVGLKQLKYNNYDMVAYTQHYNQTNANIESNYIVKSGRHKKT